MINKKFLRVKKALQNGLPYLGVAIIAFVYIGTAVLMTYFLSIRLGNTYLAALTGFGVAFTRMFIVFQSQMGLEQVTRKFDPGAIMAGVLTIYTVFECYHLAPDFLVSVSQLIFSGFIVEVIYLARLNQATRFEFYSDPAKVRMLKKSMENEKAIDNMIEQIQDENLDLSPTPSQNGKVPHELNLS